MTRIGAGFLVLIFSGLLSACGPDASFRKARAAETQKDSYRAWTLYQEFVARFPDDARAPEALFRAGWLAQQQLRDCGAAAIFYDEVAKRFPRSDPWAAWAAYGRSNCPDYFPLNPGVKWVEGDSESKGRHARIETVCEASSQGDGTLPSQAGRLVRTYFAGTTKFQSTSLGYRKDASELVEFSDGKTGAPRTVLKWPLVAGTTWRANVGERIGVFTIVAVDKTVTVAAGEFKDCLHVQSVIPGVPGATNEYYAPGVGRVLTSFSTDAGERRNTELLSFEPAPPAGVKDKGNS